VTREPGQQRSYYCQVNNPCRLGGGFRKKTGHGGGSSATPKGRTALCAMGRVQRYPSVGSEKRRERGECECDLGKIKGADGCLCQVMTEGGRDREGRAQEVRGRAALYGVTSLGKGTAGDAQTCHRDKKVN